jgi:hypothetical protein
MKRRGFLSLFSLLFARPTAALVKTPPVIPRQIPGLEYPWTRVVPSLPILEPQTLDVFNGGLPFDLEVILKEALGRVAGERPQISPSANAWSCRQQKEDS